MLSKTIGIISYLPDNENIRRERIKKLEDLLYKCSVLFPSVNIVIIAQNWKNYCPKAYGKIWVAVDTDKPLGITEARRVLRRVFLDYCNTDYLIMLDDDCELSGNNGNEYLKQIDENPDCFIEFNKTLLKLFAISRAIFKEINYDDINPEAGEGFEDRIFVNKLRKKFPTKQREFKNTGIKEKSVSTRDPYSTWYKNQDLKDMLDKTANIVEKL